jgi:hypothetical protein
MAELAEHHQTSPAAEPNPPASHIVAVIDDYSALLEAVRTRIRQTNATYSVIEETSGIPNGSLAKAVGPSRTRYFGPGLFCLLACLGLRICLIEDPQLVARYRDRLEPRQHSRHAREHWRWWKRLSAPDQLKRTNGHG